MTTSKEQQLKKGWWKIPVFLVTGWSFWFMLLLVALRWVNPPFTAFTLQEDWQALNTDRYNLRDYWVDQDEIPENIQWAVVASEDQRFWEHNGLDMVAIEKALEESEHGGKLRGASTISQQVSKNLFLSGDRSFVRKGIEAVITVGIETFWPKERILEVYLNIAEFGPGEYGIGKATEDFFGKNPMQLTNDEAARMAVVLPNPKRMRVEPPTPFVEERKDWVLRNMMQLSGIAYVPAPDPIVESANYVDSVYIDSAILSSNAFMMWMPVEDSVVYEDSLENR